MVVQRVIGFDAHPDSFTAVLLRGSTPAQAVTEKFFNKLPISELKDWAKKHTGPQDLIVLEASGNSFHIVRQLASIQRKGLVLESCHLGKLKEAHANNDKISAVRIGKAYLAGTAKPVWLPDQRTQERRDVFHAQRKAVKRTTQLSNRLDSYLSDNGVRPTRSIDPADLTKASQELLGFKEWSPWQQRIIQGLLRDRQHAEEMRAHWESVMAQEVLSDPMLLSLVRLCGIRDVVAFSLGAIIGDIHRFSNPRKLVKYFGLHPAFDHSGEGQWSGGIAGHGRKDVRSLLIQSAHAIIKTNESTARWGRKLMARKGSKNLAVAAVARKLVVAIWYLMMGRWNELEELDNRLKAKVGKIISRVGTESIQAMGGNRKQLREQVVERLKKGRTYTLKVDLKYTPRIQQNILEPVSRKRGKTTVRRIKGCPQNGREKATG